MWQELWDWWIFKKLRLHEKKKKQTHEARIVIRSVFNDGNMYYPQAFLDECLYKLAEMISGKSGQMRTGGGGWATKCGQAWAEGGGPKNCQSRADILYGWPLSVKSRKL